MGMGKKKRPATEDESSSSSERSSDDDSRETSKHRTRRSQARRKTNRKERSYSQGKEIEKLLAEVIKEEVRKQFDMIREELCQQSKQATQGMEEMYKQLEKVKEEMGQQWKQLEKVREEMRQQSKQAAESTEDICKQLNKVQEDLTGIHNDPCKQRELYTTDTSGDAFDAPRSQSNQVQPPRYRLVFKSGTIDKIDKGQPFDISVALVDGNDQTVENGLLASATVELVVVKAEFNQHNNQYNWSREDFESNIKKARQGNSAIDVDQSVKSIVSDGRFNLVHGFMCHRGSKIFSNSSNKKVRLGVMVVSPTEERVLEGLSNPFFVRGHDRPARQNNLRHNRSNTETGQAMVENGYQLQNGQTPNLQNPLLSPSSTQNGEIRWSTTTRQLQLLSSGLNINEEQLAFLGKTPMLSAEPSTSQEQRASIQRCDLPHLPMMAPEATNNQINLSSSTLVGHLENPNYMGNCHVLVHEVGPQREKQLIDYPRCWQWPQVDDID